MANNKNLHRAAAAKKDEFYTQISDIEKELCHYKEHFKDKVVFCNCDDPFESNFFKYFALNFNSLGLKKLIATCYATSPIVYTQLTFCGEPKVVATQPTKKKPYKIVITEVTDENGDGRVDLADVEYLLKNKKNVLTLLDGDGDFRSSECIELLQQADIVVTNPPFSLFREYVAQLMEYQKKFLIIGNKNSVTYKDIFSLIMQNRIWIGNRSMNSDFWLRVPKGQPFEKLIDGMPMKHIMGCWFTNLDVKKRHETMILTESYFEHPEKYPKYDNYDAINVDKTADIPYDYDYDGVMGVPITFLDKYNPEQFEIVGLTQRGCHDEALETKKYNDYWEVRPDGTKTGSSGNKTNGNPNIAMNDGKHNYFINKEGHIVQSCYQRILIKMRVSQNENRVEINPCQRRSEWIC